MQGDTRGSRQCKGWGKGSTWLFVWLSLVFLCVCAKADEAVSEPNNDNIETIVDPVDLECTNCREPSPGKAVGSTWISGQRERCSTSLLKTRFVKKNWEGERDEWRNWLMLGSMDMPILRVDARVAGNNGRAQVFAKWTFGENCTGEIPFGKIFDAKVQLDKVDRSVSFDLIERETDHVYMNCRSFLALPPGRQVLYMSGEAPGVGGFVGVEEIHSQCSHRTEGLSAEEPACKQSSLSSAVECQSFCETPELSFEFPDLDLTDAKSLVLQLEDKTSTGVDSCCSPYFECSGSSCTDMNSGTPIAYESLVDHTLEARLDDHPSPWLTFTPTRDEQNRIVGILFSAPGVNVWFDVLKCFSNPWKRSSPFFRVQSKNLPQRNNERMWSIQYDNFDGQLVCEAADDSGAPPKIYFEGAFSGRSSSSVVGEMVPVALPQKGQGNRQGIPRVDENATEFLQICQATTHRTCRKANVDNLIEDWCSHAAHWSIDEDTFDICVSRISERQRKSSSAAATEMFKTLYCTSVGTLNGPKAESKCKRVHKDQFRSDKLKQSTLSGAKSYKSRCTLGATAFKPHLQQQRKETECRRGLWLEHQTRSHGWSRVLFVPIPSCNKLVLKREDFPDLFPSEGTDAPLIRVRHSYTKGTCRPNPCMASGGFKVHLFGSGSIL
mmetsp:Transcript_13758/g.24560  ORF Transcript_13758/g.24560 Transcript_13758/m.24560 type:complete len:665 (-) Transcript_13758:66-2060(-)